ncbi:MAG: hypothetical protein OXQ89_22015 [Rhodospirillaceae bacterium]|nr:hypothetical protein [Rhodospirillaceae bacterium]
MNPEPAGRVGRVRTVFDADAALMPLISGRWTWSTRVGTVDSDRLATLKDEYRALAAKTRKSTSEAHRLEDFHEQLADAPEWNGGSEAKAQSEALHSIRELLENTGVDLSGPPGGRTRQPKSWRDAL